MMNESKELWQGEVTPLGSLNHDGVRSAILGSRGCEMRIVEGSSALTYALVLSAAPVENVTITISPGSECKHSLIFFHNETVWIEQSWVGHAHTGISYDVTFFPDDWNVPRLVTVEAVNDYEWSMDIHC